MSRGASITLDTTHACLGWPAREEVLQPRGASAAVFTALTQEKIGRALQRSNVSQRITVGLLMPDSQANTSAAPLAIVVEFQDEASAHTLRELHRLSWNFSHSPALITLEPGLLRVWSCYEPPDPERSLHEFLVHQIMPAELSDLSDPRAVSLENRAAQALHWINLISGEFFSSHAERFARDGRADQMLLGNLRHLRSALIGQGLDDDDICHDLIARIIFVQFLFDRKDSNGKAALNAERLAELQREGVLNAVHADFASILSDYDDTYRLFDWLNTRFNGDLFPGKGDIAAERAQGWRKEKTAVTPEHLALLAQFTRGDVDMPSGQGCLWPQYSFDVIPLEFISSIYEAFITERTGRDGGIYYTPRTWWIWCSIECSPGTGRRGT